MLTEIRNRATGWIAWFIVILITIPFALWGINSYFEGGADINVAIVNGEEISQQNYRYALDDRRAALGRLLGSDVDPNLSNNPEFKNSVLNGLIDQILLSTDADALGYRISDAQLNEFIRSAPQFQREGKFASDLYESAVRSQGYRLSDYESRLRQQHVVDQVRIGFTDSVVTTEADLNNLARLVLQRRDFDYTIIEPKRFIDQIEITEDDVQKKYDEQPELYQHPERIKVNFVRLAVADIVKKVSPSEDELRQAYDSNRDRYRSLEQRKASHILIKVAQDADEATDNAALEKAQALVQQARSEADFARLAKENSEDAGSTSKGGDLGIIIKGIMVQPFEEAVYRMNEGEVSDPVRTRFGYHVIKLTELVPEAVQAFEEVRDQIEQSERQRLAEAQFIEHAETFRNLVYEQPNGLEPVAEELGLPLQTTDWFSRDGGSDIASNARVREAAFSEDVFLEGLNSETIEIDINTLVALHKLEAKPAVKKPIEEVRKQIEETIRRDLARERVKQLGEELLSGLRQEQAWEELLREQKLEAKQASQTRLEQDTIIGPQVMQAVFAAPLPQAERPVFGGINTADGNYTLFRLREVAMGDPTKADKDTLERYKTILERRRGYDYFLSYQRGLREKADIQVYQDQL